MSDNNGGNGGQPSRMFMNHIKLNELSSNLVGLILSVRDLNERIRQAGMTGTQVKESFADMFPPAILFSPEIRTMPAIYSSLRDWLNEKGANLIPHSSRRILMTLATSLYDDNEDAVAATEMVRGIVARGRQSSQITASIVSGAAAASTAVSSEDHTQRENKIAHNVAMRFRDGSAKFSGDIGESWMEFVAEYQQVARDYSLTPPQKKQYLHNLLRGDAKRFYLDRVENFVNTFQQAVEMIDREYNSTVRQNRVKNYLNGLRLSKFTNEGLDESTALEKVYKLITKLAPQVPQSHRGPAHKVEFLRNATVGLPWATEPLSRIATHNLDFQQLYGELEAALHLKNEAKVAIMRDSVTNGRKRGAPDDTIVPGIMFQGQGRYINRRKSVADRRNSDRKQGQYSSGAGKIDPLIIMGCFNCDDPTHMVNNCPKKIDVTKAAKRKMEYYEKKTGEKRNAHAVLFELCQQMDSCNISEDDISDPEVVEDPDITDNSLFEALMSHADISNLPHAPEGFRTEAEINIIIDGPSDVYMSSESVDTFQGACLDTGAQKSVVGLSQAEAYYRYMGLPLVIKQDDPNVYKFGSQKTASIGKANFRIPYARNCEMILELDVVDVHIPLIVGLDSLDKYKLFVDNVDDLLVCKDPTWSCPIVRKFGHLYYTWDYCIMYSEQELKRIHRHFYHPQPDRIFNLMKRASDPNATPDTLKALEKLTRSCDICQRMSEQPGRFRVSLPHEKVVFNRLVLMDLMKLEKKTVLHIICRDTLFSVAVFLLDGESTNDVWIAYVRHWVNPYIGFSKIIHTDQGSQFNSDEWRSFLRSAGIEHHMSGVQSHNALNVGERYHEYLRQIYRKVRLENPSLNIEEALSTAVHAMNSTAGQNGLVPTLLVFGTVPRFPFIPSELPEQRARMKAMKDARDEMTKAVAANRLKTALSRNVPIAADNEVKVGMDVLVYREKPEKQWVGPFRVVAGDEKSLWLNVRGKLSQVSIDKVREYKKAYEEKDLSAPSPQTVPSWSPQPDMDGLMEMDKVFERIISGEAFMNQLLKGISEVTKNGSDSQISDETPPSVLLTEVLSPDDPRCHSKEFENAKHEEITGLRARKTWDIVNASALPKTANVISGRFVYSLKNVGTLGETARARFVAQGFNDKMKPFIVHNNHTLRQSSTKLIISVSSICQFRLCHLDVTQAYLQSKDRFSREIYLKPKRGDMKYFQISDNELLHLVKPLYGICDAGDYWGTTFRAHILQSLKMVPLKGDPALYIKHHEDDIEGLLGSYVDDNLFSGTAKFLNVAYETQRTFESKDLNWDNIEFVGVKIETRTDNEGVLVLELSQPEYTAKLKEVPVDVQFEFFASVRAAVGWLAHTRPDACCSINRAAQVTEKTFSKKKVIELNKAIKYLKQTPYLKLKYKPLNRQTLHLRVYSDASFASNDDSSSQLGYIILLCDDSSQCHILCYSSRKSKRVVRSIMAGEVYAFSAAFDQAFMLKHDLEHILNQSIPLAMFTDSKQLFDVITCASHSTEKRLMIDVAAAREAYERHEISNVGLVSGEHNVADGLTKPKFCKALHNVMRYGVDKTPVVQWIHRHGL